MNKKTTNYRVDRESGSTPWIEGTPYSIKRHGVTLVNCDIEPVQTPGCIQNHGVVIALRLSDLTILQISENSEEWLEQAPEALLGKSVASILGEDRVGKLKKLLALDPVEHNPLYVGTLPARGKIPPLDVVVHSIDGFLIVELEATARNEDHFSPDYYAVLKKSIVRLRATTSVSDFCQQLTVEVRTVTGLDRAMVYRFHPDGHGEVIAESKREDLPSWLGLHYPAEDIPQPARDIFHKIWIRPLRDVRAPLAELVPLANPENGRPLPMTYCALRGASTMYTEYLQNMGVAASLTMPILREGHLWGLIACHHSTPVDLPYPVRSVCEFLAQIVSLQIVAVENQEQLRHRLRLEETHNRLVGSVAHDGVLTDLLDGTTTLLDAINSSGVALHYRDRWWCSGRTPTESQLDALTSWLMPQIKSVPIERAVYATDSLQRDYAAGAELSECATGILAVMLSAKNQQLIIWFRQETVQTIHWAGDPHDVPSVVGPNGPRLTPRASFEVYVESVRHRSLPWTPVEIEAVLRLRTLLLELVVRRTERLAELNSELLRSNEELDTFAYVASHDLKEPLRGIYKYAHQLREQALELNVENRQRLDKLAQLTVRMDSLLDGLLHFSRIGRAQMNLTLTDLNEVVEEALDMAEARRMEQDAQIVISRPLPSVYCDPIRVREVYVNLLSNALKYSDKPVRRIEIGYWQPGEPDAPPQLPQSYSGTAPVFYVRDNGLGIEARHQQQIFKIFKRLHVRDAYGGGVGVGLTIVRLLLERHHGQIWLDSTPGEGTTFFFTLGSDDG